MGLGGLGARVFWSKIMPKVISSGNRARVRKLLDLEKPNDFKHLQLFMGGPETLLSGRLNIDNGIQSILLKTQYRPSDPSPNPLFTWIQLKTRAHPSPVTSIDVRTRAHPSPV